MVYEHFVIYYHLSLSWQMTKLTNLIGRVLVTVHHTQQSSNDVTTESNVC